MATAPIDLSSDHLTCASRVAEENFQLSQGLQLFLVLSTDVTYSNLHPSVCPSGTSSIPCLMASMASYFISPAWLNQEAQLRLVTL